MGDLTLGRMHGVPLAGRVMAVAAPGLVLAGIGVTHPMDLTPSTAHYWWAMHVALLPLFPTLAVLVWALVRGDDGAVAWCARIAAYGFAAFYTALDTLVGIGAGVALDAGASGPVVARLLRIGNQLAVPGKVFYVVAVVLVGYLAVRRYGRRALAGALIIVVAAVPFVLDHIYWPAGVMAMLGTSVGAAALEVARRATTADADSATAADVDSATAADVDRATTADVDPRPRVAAGGGPSHHGQRSSSAAEGTPSHADRP